MVSHRETSPMGRMEHVEYIDALKGFGMFLVVMGHVIAWSFNSYGAGFYVPEATDTPAVLLWWHIIYSFHMPLLFWISGCLLVSPSRPFAANMLPGYLWRKTYTLLIPFFVAGLTFMAITGEPFTKYWFLRTLFIFILMSLPYELVRQRGLKGHRRLVVGVDIAYYMVLVQVIKILSWKHRGDIVDVLWDSEHMLHFQYFVFGIFCSRYFSLKKLLDSNWCYTVALVLFCCGTFITNASNQTEWATQTAYLLVPYCGIICAHYLFKSRFTSGRFVEWLKGLGRHSLEVYILHFYFVISIPQVGAYVIRGMQEDAFHGSMASTAQLLYGAAVACIICVLSLLATRVLRSSNALSLLLLGRKNKKPHG